MRHPKGSTAKAGDSVDHDYNVENLPDTSEK